MTIFYFSSTGNNLYVAKQLGGTLVPVPKAVEEERYEYKDDCIGIVFPVYGLCVPPYIEQFIKKLHVDCEYLFGIATYGFFAGAVCSQLQEIRTGNGRCFDYINQLKMAENCITFSDMAKQKGDTPGQQKQLEKITEEIRNKKCWIRSNSRFSRMMTDQHSKNYEFAVGTGITDRLTITSACTGCGTCERICPMNNIRVEKGSPCFGKNCISCGGCLQNCPKKAIHHKAEKSDARYRNPHVEVKELMYR